MIRDIYAIPEEEPRFKENVLEITDMLAKTAPLMEGFVWRMQKGLAQEVRILVAVAVKENFALMMLRSVNFK